MLHQKDRSELTRGITRLDLAALVVNTVIGAGILGLPGRVYGLVGDWSLVVLIGTAALIAAFALCFAELSSRFDRTGGPYLYVTEAFGSLPGFAIGWLLWLSRVLTTATQLNLFVEYAAGPAPALAGGVGRAATIVGVVAAFCILTLGGVTRSARASTLFTVAKIMLFALFVGVGLFSLDSARLLPSAAPPTATLSDAMLLLLFAFFGFETVTVVAGETRDARRVVPAGILGGLVLIMLIYAAVTAITISVLPNPATSERAVAIAARAMLGPAGATAATVGAMIILLGALTGGFILAPRLLYALAEHRQLPRPFAHVHPRWHTPHVAIATSCVAIALLALFNSFLSALVLSSAVRLIAYIACCFALLKLRRADSPPAGFQAPAGLMLAVIGIAVAAAVLAVSATREIAMAGLALAAGLPLLWLSQRRED